jgi:hypothetical protein
MKRHHKAITVVGASVIILMLLFPPFHVMYAPGIEIDKGYAFILKPPRFWGSMVSTVDMNLLLFQVGAVVAVLGVVHLFSRAGRK